MKKYILLLFIVLCSAQTRSESLNFSNDVEISLLTCSPGKEIYAKFGHTAIRVKDNIKNLDLAFSWGLFDFDTKHFYLKFLQGKTDYMLGVSSTSFFLNHYKERNSSVTEQLFDLNENEKKRFIEALLHNYIPENREYRYNFVFDNCATRPRDMLIRSIDGHFKLIPKLESRTYRSAINSYLGENNWTRFGVDVVLGYQADKFMPQIESMFLPEIMKYEINSAKNSDIPNRTSRDITKKTQVLVGAQAEEAETLTFWEKPTQVFILLLILVFLISAYEIIFRKPYITAIDSILLAATGIAGIVVFFLMFFSLHPLVQFNFNILWLNPLNLFAAILIWFKRFKIYMFLFQLANLLLVVLALVSVAISLQTFNLAIFIFIAILMCRYSAWIYRTKKRLTRKSMLKIFKTT